jgi:putative glutamine amidotransferase
MKPLVAVSQRVAEVAGYNERRDALDQRWYQLLSQAGLTPLLIPNHPDLALELVTRLKPQGLLLTGGNSLVSCGGDAPERDKTEKALLSGYALSEQVPVLGVCRGMQLMLEYFEQSLVEVQGHVCKRQSILFDELAIDVNSYQTWGCYDVPPDFKVRGRSSDGVVKAMSHERLPLHGVMWHPERLEPFRKQDLEIIKEIFRA